MKTHVRHHRIRNRLIATFGLASAFLAGWTSQAQQVPPGVASQFNNTVGARVEALTVLGGDYGVAGGTYKTTGGGNFDTHLNLSKFGGSGDIGDPQPLGNTGIGFQPRLQGSMGYAETRKNYTAGPLNGDESEYKTFAIQFGGGGRFWFNDYLSLAPTFMGMYGHTKNDYDVQSAIAQQYAPQLSKAGLINWNIDTWTVRPAINAQCIIPFHRTLITLASDFAYFHTESFSSSSSLLNINGDSESWRNMIDVDVPVGKQLFGHEIRTGGFFSRTEFYDNLQTGLNTDHMYEAHARVVLDYLNQLWKVQWIGLGASYLWGSNFNGYSFGADIAFRF